MRTWAQLLKCVCSACCMLNCNMSSICYKMLKADYVHGFESMRCHKKVNSSHAALHVTGLSQEVSPSSFFSISHSCQQLVFLSLPAHVVRTLIIHLPQREAGSQYQQESLFSSLSPCVPSTSAKTFSEGFIASIHSHLHLYL